MKDEWELTDEDLEQLDKETIEENKEIRTDMNSLNPRYVMNVGSINEIIDFEKEYCAKKTDNNYFKLECKDLDLIFFINQEAINIACEWYDKIVIKRGYKIEKTGDFYGKKIYYENFNGYEPNKIIIVDEFKPTASIVSFNTKGGSLAQNVTGYDLEVIIEQEVKHFVKPKGEFINYSHSHPYAPRPNEYFSIMNGPSFIDEDKCFEGEDWEFNFVYNSETKEGMIYALKNYGKKMYILKEIGSPNHEGLQRKLYEGKVLEYTPEMKGAEVLEYPN